MIRRAMAFSTLLLTVLVVAPVEAQRGPPMGRRGGQGQNPDRERLEQQIRARMGQMMRQQLGLSEEEGARLGEIVQEFEPARRQLARDEQAVRRRVEALMLEDSDDQDEAAGLLERLATIRQQDAELFAQEQQMLLEVLTPLQVLRFHQLREQLGERIQRFRQGQRGRGGDGQGEPGARRRRGGGASPGSATEPGGFGLRDPVDVPPSSNSLIR